MAQRPVPREPGEDLKLVGFRASMSMDAAIEAKASQLGMGKAELLRHMVERFLDSDREVAA